MSALIAHPELHFIVAGDPGQRTGGYLYDAHIVTQLRRLGWQLTVKGLAGHFPAVDAQARQAMDAALSTLAEDSLVVIDGLALGGLPEVVVPHARRLRLLALVHHPLADEGGLAPAQQLRVEALEREALSAMRGVITTSHFSAHRVARMGLADVRIEVVEPGVQARPLAAADHSPARLLCVASLTPRKGHDLLVEALAMVTELDWQCDCIGSLTRDVEHAGRVRGAIAHHGLGERIHLRGELDDAALHAAYTAADLFVLPSHYEGYGMVITEAVAAGLPVLCTTGGALRHTLPPEAGIAVPAGDVPALAAALRHLLSHPEARFALRDGARRARPQLTDWVQAGRQFAAALERLSTPSGP
ncbi:glycosyltransferase family 4 protein [Thauera terpenica]